MIVDVCDIGLKNIDFTTPFDPIRQRRARVVGNYGGGSGKLDQCIDILVRLLIQVIKFCYFLNTHPCLIF